MYVFRIIPKRIKRTNGTVLTPDMSVTVTVRSNSDPFYNGAKEIQQMYMQLYGFDYRKACCQKSDFDYVRLA